MNRRQFVGAATAAVLTGLGSWSSGTEQIRRIGLQLYTVRRAMQQDFDGTLAKVAATGYREVEFAGYFGCSPQDVKRSLAAVGLVSPSSPYRVRQARGSVAVGIGIGKDHRT